MSRLGVASVGLAGALMLAGCVDNPLATSNQSAVKKPAFAVAAASAARGGGRTGRHIISFSGAVPATFAGDVQALGGRVLWVSAGNGLATVSGLSAAAVASLSARQGIAAVDEDASLSLELPKLGTVDGGGVAGATSNDDPAGAVRYARQWNMRAVQADAAWARGFLGSSHVSIYMLDSGIDYLHSDLVGRVDLDRSVDLLGTFDADMPDGSTVPFTEADTVQAYFPGRLAFTDLFFHGTHTGATVSSNAVRAAGITSKTTLVAVKVCGYIDQCPFSSILNGVDVRDHGEIIRGHLA